MAVTLLALGAGQAPTAAAPGSVAQPVPGVVQLFPAPGTETASPDTQLSFRGTPAGSIEGLTVVGSATGQHSGRWLRHSDGRGTSFFADAPFRPGETVTLTSPAVAITGCEDRPCSFSIAEPGPTQFSRDPRTYPLGSGPSLRSSAERPASRSTPPPDRVVHRYRSRPDLRPPAISTTSSPSASPGLLFASVLQFLGPDPDVQPGNLIYDNAGQPVWFGPSDTTLIGNLTPITYRGAPAIAFFDGRQAFLGVYWGEWVVLDTSYRELGRIRAGNGYEAEAHELQISPDGRRALFVIYAAVQMDMSPYGGPTDATVLETVIQEVDLTTGAVTFEWHSLDDGNIPVTDSYVPLNTPVVDYIHANSAEYDLDGDFLVSGRHISAIIKIDRETGQLVWLLGGKRNQFTFLDGDLGPDFPHDARRRADGTLSMFDNGINRQTDYSRSVAYQLNETTKTAMVAEQHRHDPDLHTAIVGSSRRQPNGNELISWGTAATATEYQGSAVAFESRLTFGIFSYRTVRAPWQATPARPPDLALDRHPGGVGVFTSWNGATEVATWELWAGPDQGNLRRIDSTPRSGFETAFLTATADTDRYFQTRAVDSTGKLIGASEPTPDPIHRKYLELGGPGSFLGQPSGGIYPVPGGLAQNYEGGIIYWSPATGAHEVHGAILWVYISLGGPNSFLGLPIFDELPTPGGAGRFSHFQGGSIYSNPAAGTHEVHGAIKDKWAGFGWEQSFLGFPTTNETSTPDQIGRYNHFQGGSIYWTPGTGAHEVHGAIRNRWASLGWERSRLGYPTTDETSTPDQIGRYNHFQGGSIYWTPGTGAHEVHGAIQWTWASLGWERSRLGYPTSGEFTPAPGARQNNFQGGYIRTDANGTQVVYT